MEFGYITFDNQEHQEIIDVLKRVNAGTIDELGLGRIRDFFSNQMFPGMSTLHNRAKYFVLLPSLYEQLSRSVKSAKDIPEKLKEWERNMTISLLRGKDNNDDKNGITGGDFTIEQIEAGAFVKNTPTDIYLSSLRFFGLVDNSANLYTQIEKESKRVKMSKLTADEKRENGDSDEPIGGTDATFCCFPGYDFEHSASPISLSLTHYEAEVLKSRICKKCEGRLYAHLLQNEDIPIVSDFHAMKNELHNKLPIELSDIFDKAYDFSLWAQVVNTYYRYVYYQLLHDSNEANLLMTNINVRLHDSNESFPSKERIKEILDYVEKDKDFKDSNNVIEFCKEVNNIIRESDKGESLVNLIIMREKLIKPGHNKIDNPRYSKEALNCEAPRYTYRWNSIVYSMIRDIRNFK